MESIAILAGLVFMSFCVRIRDRYRRVTREDDRRMATRIVRPYAVVEGYDSQGNRVLPTIVYSAEQAEMAEQRYAADGCCTIVRTPLDYSEYTTVTLQ